jgi:hypothetical protein
LAARDQATAAQGQAAGNANRTDRSRSGRGAEGTNDPRPAGRLVGADGGECHPGDAAAIASLAKARFASDTEFVEIDLRLAFLGGATIYQDGRKFDVTATLYAEGPTPTDSFFGHYEGAVPEGIASGAAMIRFSDGSQADAALAAVDPDRGGFRLTSDLRDLSLGV